MVHHARHREEGSAVEWRKGGVEVVRDVGEDGTAGGNEGGIDIFQGKFEAIFIDDDIDVTVAILFVLAPVPTPVLYPTSTPPLPTPTPSSC